MHKEDHQTPILKENCSKVSLEICIDNNSSLDVIQTHPEQVKVDRLEICSNLGAGGLTPTIGFLRYVVKTCTIPFRVLIRPRAGDFVYDFAELDMFFDDVEAVMKICSDCKRFEGLVIGAASLLGRLDVPALKEIIEQARKFKADCRFTINRAVDLLDCDYEVLAQDVVELMNYGCDGILTSGRFVSEALRGVNSIDDINIVLERALTDREEAANTRQKSSWEALDEADDSNNHPQTISLIAAGGLRAGSTQDLFKHLKTQIRWIHSSCLSKKPSKEYSSSAKMFGPLEIIDQKALTELCEVVQGLSR